MTDDRSKNQTTPASTPNKTDQVKDIDPATTRPEADEKVKGGRQTFDGVRGRK